MNPPHPKGASPALALAAIHTIAALELGISITYGGPATVTGWLALLSAWAGSLLIAGTLFLLVYLPAAAGLLIGGRRPGVSVVLASAAAAAGPIVLIALAGSVEQAFHHPPGVVIAAVLVAAAGAAVYSVGQAVDWNSAAGSSLIKAALAAPFVVASALLLVWLRFSYLRGVLGFVTLPLWGVLVVSLVMVGGFLLWRSESLSSRIPVALAVWSTVLLAALAWQGLAPARTMPQLTLDATGTRSIAHIVLITVDTLRADALSQGLASHCESPTLDTLGAESVRFTSAYASSPWTSPSVASILNGLSPAVHGVGRQRAHIPSTPPTLEDFLQDAGYLTAAFGGNILLTPQDSLQRGFDVYRFPGLPPVNTLARQALAWYRGPIRMSDQHRTEDITADAEGWVRLHAAQNFFLWVHYFDPHAPYLPPREFLPEGDPEAAYEVGLGFDEDRAAAKFVPQPLPRQEMIRDLYCGEVQYVDNRIGRLIGHMKGLGIYDDALIVLTSDHGEEFWEHGSAFHGHSMHNELLRVPLFLKMPRGTPRTTIDQPTSNVAVTPSILDLAEVDFDPNQFSEPSLTPFWRGKQPSPRPIYAGHNFLSDEQEAIIFEGWKYIQHQNTWMNELYDLENDPEERANRLSSEPERTEQMRELLDTHIADSRELRRKIGGSGRVPDEVREKMQRRLRSLGYIE